MTRDPYPKLTLKISRKPDVQPIYVHCDICRLTERRWKHSDDGLPVCVRCRHRERVGPYSPRITSATWNDIQHMLAGLALVRAIQDTIKLQRMKGLPHG